MHSGTQCIKYTSVVNKLVSNYHFSMSTDVLGVLLLLCLRLLHQKETPTKKKHILNTPPHPLNIHLVMNLN